MKKRVPSRKKKYLMFHDRKRAEEFRTVGNVYGYISLALLIICVVSFSLALFAFQPLWIIFTYLTFYPTVFSYAFRAFVRFKRVRRIINIEISYLELDAYENEDELHIARVVKSAYKFGYILPFVRSIYLAHEFKKIQSSINAVALRHGYK